MLTTVSPEFMREVCAILGEDGISEEDLESRVLAIADSPMHARRLVDWTREAFGLILIGHLGKVQFPTTFNARDAAGQWLTFDFAAEPLFATALREAAELAHAGPRVLFANIATKGSLFIAVNKALKEGANIDGASLSGPSFVGIPAEIYLANCTAAPAQ